ncbi:MAG: hypothetical protein AB7J40_05530 [Candidatus Altimarinota bacterium]
MNLGQELQQHYPDLYPEVESIFNKHDPLDFQPGISTPQNEYDLEILELLPILEQKPDEKTIYDKLLEIFYDKFGEETIQNREKKLLKNIAQDIANFLK